MSNFQNFVRDRAGVVAYRLAPVPDCVDATGRDREDYQSLMCLRVLESLERAKEEPGREVEWYRWTTTLLQNRTTDCRREQTLANATFVSEDSVSEQAGTYNFEEHLVNRDLLKRLCRSLEASDWSLLVAYVQHGTVTDTWRAYGMCGSERTFRRRIVRLLTLCRELIQKISY